MCGMYGKHGSVCDVYCFCVIVKVSCFIMSMSRCYAKGYMFHISVRMFQDSVSF